MSLSIPSPWHLEIAHFGISIMDTLGDSGTTHTHSTVLGLITLVLTQIAVTEHANVVFLGIGH